MTRKSYLNLENYKLYLLREALVMRNSTCALVSERRASRPPNAQTDSKIYQIREGLFAFFESEVRRSEIVYNFSFIY